MGDHEASRTFTIKPQTPQRPLLRGPSHPGSHASSLYFLTAMVLRPHAQTGNVRLGSLLFLEHLLRQVVLVTRFLD